MSVLKAIKHAECFPFLFKCMTGHVDWAICHYSPRRVILLAMASSFFLLSLRRVGRRAKPAPCLYSTFPCLFFLVFIWSCARWNLFSADNLFMLETIMCWQSLLFIPLCIFLLEHAYYINKQFFFFVNITCCIIPYLFSRQQHGKGTYVSSFLN
jgi:hypothetical protein